MAEGTPEPDIYVLNGDGIAIVYETHGEDGPMLSYSGPVFPGSPWPRSGTVHLSTAVAPLDGASPMRNRLRPTSCSLPTPRASAVHGS
jgi:hypothetical protein